MPKSYISRTAAEPQQGASWNAPGGVLGELLRNAEVRATALRPRREAMERELAGLPVPPSMIAALSRSDVAIIAEIKRASPSRGAIQPGIDAARQARAYADGGAAAVSVLTEPSRFGSLPGDLEHASAAVRIPLLRKDFILTEDQIVEARLGGAAAVLLIARALPPGRLSELVSFARAAGVEPLVEVHDEGQLATALATGAPLIGINARDLETLAVDAALVPRLVARVPGDRVCVAESGLAGRSDVERVAEAGVDAVLVGSALSAASDPAAAVRGLTGVGRRARAP